MNVFVDIDGTITFKMNGNTNYADALPIPERIAKINARFDNGDRITYFTARGTETGIDWGELTRLQLNLWGCKYHEILFGKPVFDLLIDDRAMNANDLQ